MVLISSLYVATAYFMADPLYGPAVLIGAVSLALIAVYARDRARRRRAARGPVFIPRQRSGRSETRGTSGRTPGAN